MPRARASGRRHGRLPSALTLVAWLDRAAAAAFLGFGGWLGIDLVRAALTDTLWLLLPAALVLGGVLILLPSLVRRPYLGLRPVWPDLANWLRRHRS